MEILTVYNYPPNNLHFYLLKMWLSQLTINNDLNCNIIVLSENYESKEIKKLHSQYDFTWKKLKPNKKEGYPIYTWVRHRISGDIGSYRKTKNRLKILNHHNVRFKLFHLSNWPGPFIFLDVDAILFSPISELIKASKFKPFIAINHQRIPKHTDGKEEYLNGGVQIVSKPGYYKFEDFTKETDNLLCSGHEQALIYSYFKKIGYDYTHPDIDYKWNACSGYNELKKIDGKWRCYSTGRNILDISKKSDSISKGIEICINHYWDEFKPWKTGCPMYKEFLLEGESFKRI